MDGMNYDFFYTYILASASGTLYIGITNDIKRRVAEHKAKINDGFSSKYSCDRLVYIERFFDPSDAILREKQLKRWNREKKEWLIRSQNPGWKDMSEGWRLPVVARYE
jgi:putative endonuclease